MCQRINPKLQKIGKRRTDHIKGQEKYKSHNGDKTRNTLHEFDSNNTKLLTVEETKKKIASLAYIQDELAKMGM